MAIDPCIEQLLRVKTEEIDTRKQLNEARQALFNCSPLDNVAQWTVLLDNITKLVIKLHDIEKELRELEYKHVVVKHGTLPY